MAYQFHCPKCHHEFTYDRDNYDETINELKNDIESIKAQFTEYNQLSYPEREAKKDWYYRTKRKYTAIQKELGKMKSFRAAANKQLQKTTDQVFKSLVKELIGEEAYIELMTKAQEELEAYKVSDMMKHEYTKASGRSTVTKVEKLR